MGFGSSFIGGRCSVEERERESRRRAGLRSAGGADVPFGCAWRPLGTGGPTWQDEGRPAEAARAVGEAARRHVGERRAAQVCSRLGKRPAAVDHARAAETEEIGEREVDEGGPG
jgi:hypothetical protein